jgi:hypothetical protein
MSAMNAITRLELIAPPMPSIARVQAVEHLTIRVEWSAGIRHGRTDEIDLSPMINVLKLYRPLRENRKLFRTVHLIEDGRVLAWGDDDEIDMAADSVEELAEETMTSDDLRKFLIDNNLTQGEAAALLDRSRRQIANYLSGSEPIPRGFVLSCFGLIARKQLLRGPITQPHQASVQVQVIDRISATETLKTSFEIVRPAQSRNMSFGETTAIETCGS